MSDLPPGAEEVDELPLGAEAVGDSDVPPGAEAVPHAVEASPGAAEFLAKNHPNSPDQIAAAKDHAETLGVPTNIALADPKLAQASVAGQEVGWLAKHFPKAAEWLGEDNHRPGMVRDDSGTLANIVGALTHAVPTAWHMIKDQELLYRQAVELGNVEGGDEASSLGKLFLEKGLIGIAKRELPHAGPENQARISELEGRAAEQAFPANNPVSKAINTFATVGTTILMDQAARVVGGAVGTAIGARVGGEPGAAIGAGIGQFGSSFAFNTFELAGPIYWQLSKLKDPEGKPLDPTVARVAAMVAAGAGGAVMSGGFGLLAAEKKVIASGAAKTAAELLAKPGFAAWATQFAKGWTQNQLTGALMMGINGGINADATERAKQISNAVSGTHFDVDESAPLKAIAEHSIEALYTMPLVSALHPALQIRSEAKARANYSARLQDAGASIPGLEEVGNLFRTSEHAQMLDSLINGSKTSALLTKSPKEFERFIAKMKTTDGAAQAVGIPVEAFDKYWKSQGGNPEEVASTLGVNYSEAKATSGDVVIPMEKFLSTLGKTDHAKNLAADSRLHFKEGADTFTPNEAQAFAESVPQGSRYLTALHENQSPAQRELTYYIDPNTGVLNTRAASDTPLQPGEKVFRVGQEGTKHLNDIVSEGTNGPEIADAKSRAFAKTLNDIAPGKVFLSPKGDFEIRGVFSDEQAQQLHAAIVANSHEAFHITSAYGDTRAEADQSFVENKIASEASGARAARGEKPVNLKVHPSELKFAPDRAVVEVPAALKNTLAARSSAQAFRDVYLDKQTGLLSGKGFSELPKRAHTIVFDVPGLGAISKVHGETVGDHVLKQFANVAHELGGSKYDLARLHGDEFVIHGDNPKELQAFAEKLKKVLTSANVGINDQTTGQLTHRLNGADVNFAGGRDIGEAGRELAASKQLSGSAEQRAAKALNRIQPVDTSPEVVNSLHQNGPPSDLPGGGGAPVGRSLPAQDYARVARPRRTSLSEAQVTEALSEARSISGQDASPPASDEARAARSVADDAAKAHLQKRIEEIQTQRTGPVRDRIHEAVTNDVDAQPVWRASRYLQLGELPDGEGGWSAFKGLPKWLRSSDGQAFKLDKAEVVARYGEAVVDELPSGIFANKKTNSLESDNLAGRLGFNDGRDLIDALRTNPPREKMIEQTTQSKLDELYGPALKQIREAALDAAHSPEELHAQLLQLRDLAQQVNPEAAKRVKLVDPEAMKASAQRMIDAAPQGAIIPNRYQQQERKAALEVARLSGAGEVDAARAQAESRLFNSMMYRAAREAQEISEKGAEKLKSFAKDTVRAQLGKAGSAYRDSVDTLLQSLGIGGKINVEPGALDRLAETGVKDGFDLSSLVDVSVLEDLVRNPRSWDELTTVEGQTVVDAVTAIRKAATNINEVFSFDRAQSKDAALAELEASLKARGAKIALRPADKENVTKLDKLKGTAADAAATLMTDETWTRLLDNGDENGVVRRLLLDPYSKLKRLKDTLIKKYTLEILDHYKELPKELQNKAGESVDLWKDIPFPEKFRGKLDEGPVTRGYLYMMFLNMGNSGNRRWLTESMGVSDQRIAEVLGKHLSHEEMSFLQKGVLNTLKNMRAPIAEAHEADTGLPLGMVEATPIRVGNHVYEGGYFPAKVDSGVSRVAEQSEAQAVANIQGVADFFPPGYSRPFTAKGHTKDRAQNSSQVPDLSWGVLTSHINQAVHDLVFRKFIKQSASLVLDPRFNSLVDQYAGKDVRNQIVPWLYAVANSQSESLPDALKSTKPILGAIRSYQARKLLGGNIGSLAGHYFDPILAAAGRQVGITSVLAAMAKAHSPAWSDMRQFALENSATLQSRSDKLARESAQELKQIGTKSRVDSILHRTQEVGAVANDLMEHYVTTVTWSAKYKETVDALIKNGSTPEDAHKEAVRQADTTVENVYPSADPVKQSLAVRRKDFLGTALFMFSFRNKMLNLRLQAANEDLTAFRNSSSLTGKASALASTLGTVLAMSATGIAYQVFKGHGKEQDETDTQFATRMGLAETFSDLPIAAEVSSALADRLVLKKPVDLRLSNTPVAMLVEDLYKQATKSTSSTTEENLANSISLLAGTVLGMPSQTIKTVDYLRRLQGGQVLPQDALQLAGGVIYGQNDKHPRENPFTLGSRLYRR